MTPFVLMIGLGMHSIFEGLAVGINGNANEVEIFALAIILHKGAAGMSLGISMAKTFPEKETFIYSLLFMFSLFTPLGVGIGWLIVSRGGEDTNPLPEIIFSSLAAGTFVYIACSEVIVEEFSLPDHKFLKLFFFVIGVAIITSLLFME